MFNLLPPFKTVNSLLRAAAVVVVLTVGASAVVNAQVPTSARQLLDGYVAEALAANLTIAQQSAALSRANAGVREAMDDSCPASA
ncbi:hypothetical protein [Gemmatimonas sp.]|uniref:hypothetical protein n=1 Tax=Gemmatimonas sp. TaxID=1962908 RepID=UPI003561A65C